MVDYKVDSNLNRGYVAPANTAPANTAPANTAPANTAPANTAPINVLHPNENGENIVWENNKSSNKKLWIWLGVFFIFVILFIGILVVVLMNNSVIELSAEDIKIGKSIEFSEGDSAKFVLAEEEHSITLNSVGDYSAKIIVGDSPIKTSLNIGETKSFDLNGDGVYDLSVKLERIVDGNPVLFIVRFIEEVVEKENVEDFETETELNLTEEDEYVIVLINESNASEVLTCSEAGGNICGGVQNCNGSLMDVSDTDYCCDEACETEEVIVEENISNEEFCGTEEKYFLPEDGYLCAGDIDSLFNGEDNVSCCSVPVVEIVVISDEIRSAWNSIADSGECEVFYSQPEYLSKLEECSPYKCHFNHPLDGMVVAKGVIGEYDGKCYTLEEMPNDGEVYCAYDDSRLTKVVDFIIFIEEQCSDVECSFILNDTGYFVNDILTENVPQYMIDSRTCEINFG